MVLHIAFYVFWSLSSLPTNLLHPLKKLKTDKIQLSLVPQYLLRFCKSISNIRWACYLWCDFIRFAIYARISPISGISFSLVIHYLTLLILHWMNYCLGSTYRLYWRWKCERSHFNSLAKILKIILSIPFTSFDTFSIGFNYFWTFLLVIDSTVKQWNQ